LPPCGRFSKMFKRLLDISGSVVGLALLAPVLLTIAALVKVGSSGPIFFRQVRVGRFGKPFLIHKFRTMEMAAEQSGQLTIGNDRRITSIGHVLRKYKLDELPQLIDVLWGSMSLVGPRPEVPKYVDCYSEEDRSLVLSVRPGMTDLASIEFRDEAAILGRAVDPEVAYIDQVLPAKLAYYRAYARSNSVWLDVTITFRTITAIVVRPSPDRPGCGPTGRKA